MSILKEAKLVDKDGKTHHENINSNLISFRHDDLNFFVLGFEEDCIKWDNEPYNLQPLTLVNGIEMISFVGQIPEFVLKSVSYYGDSDTKEVKLFYVYTGYTKRHEVSDIDWKCGNTTVLKEKGVLL